MGLYERDYMRRQQGADDRYWAWLHGADFSGRRTGRPGGRSSPPSGWRAFWLQPIGFKRALIAVALPLGLFVLPHLTIAGRHWQFWFLPF